MPDEDARRWNARYRDGYYGDGPRPREILELALPYLRPRGLILDLAMGLGVNARWLVEHEFRVVGVDIAGTAVLQAKRQCPPLMAVIADLNEFPIPAHAFDAVLNFYFLDRGLLGDLVRIVSPGGLAIVETLNGRAPGERPVDFVRELRRVIADSLVEITPLRPERQAAVMVAKNMKERRNEGMKGGRTGR